MTDAVVEAAERVLADFGRDFDLPPEPVSQAHQLATRATGHWWDMQVIAALLDLNLERVEWLVQLAEQNEGR